MRHVNGKKNNNNMKTRVLMIKLKKKIILPSNFELYSVLLSDP